MIVVQALDFDNVMFVGVDPGTLSLGVCLLSGGGVVIRTWSVRAVGDPLRRMSVIHGGVAGAFREIRTMAVGRRVELLVEDGIYRSMPKVCAMIGEVRGLVMAEAWRCGWSVRKVSPMTWKAGMTKPERAMKKGAAYVAYWNRRLSIGCRTPDEIDSVMVARQALPKAG